MTFASVPGSNFGLNHSIMVLNWPVRPVRRNQRDSLKMRA